MLQPALAMVAAGRTDVGRVRARNEDYFVLKPENGLAVVCDGMGGHSGGDVASRTVAETLSSFLASREVAEDIDSTVPGAGAVTQIEREARASIIDAVDQANQRLIELNGKHGLTATRAMGTTVVGMRYIASTSRAIVFHAGDSRLYRLRGHQFEQLTSDHSLYQMWLDSGRHGQAPNKNIIVRALGASEQVDPDINLFELATDDLFLLCSDGLTGMVDDAAILTILSGCGDDLDGACARLIEKANANGGLDNVTVVLVRFMPLGR